MPKNKILGIGIDMEEVGRFEKLPFEKDKSFYEKIFTKNEIEYCLSKDNPYPHFAARFCAKEATVKAYPRTIGNLLDIEVAKIGDKPEIRSRVIKEKIHLSISHTKDQAVAMVIIEAR